jgi:hypothetical protein
LRRPLQRAKRQGDLPPRADPGELARYVMTVLQGMAVRGTDGNVSFRASVQYRRPFFQREGSKNGWTPS